MKAGYRERIAWALEWKRAEDAWPPETVVGTDIDWARKVGTGFVANRRHEILYLVDRDWFGWPDPPRWGLASFDSIGGKWQVWGSFDDLAACWTSLDGRIDVTKSSIG